MRSDTKGEGADVDVEMQPLMATTGTIIEQTKTKLVNKTVQSGGAREIFNRIEEKVNVKSFCRVWEPTLGVVVRVMLVSSFIDDSIQMATHLSEQVEQVSEQGWGSGVATAALVVGVGAQWISSFCVIRLLKVDYATKALIGWSIAQPVLYGQLSNFEFVAESLSIIGGLLMLRSSKVGGAGDGVKGGGVVNVRTHLVGRLLLPAMYVFYAGQFLFSALTEEETSSIAMFISSLSIFILTTLTIFALLIGSALVAIGLKSRVVALLLALVNLFFVFFMHPFFLFASRVDGEWVYDDDMPIPNVSLPEGISLADLAPEQIYALHRYYFFLGISTSGALLLLAQLGPCGFAVQKNEILLPTRAQD